MTTNNDFEPHEELEQIDRYTNDDGTVSVELDGWEKSRHGSDVIVTFFTPVGEEKTERMKWPESKDESYKFIRLIGETPYSLATAGDINDDSDIRVNADPDSWELVVPEHTPWQDRIPVTASGAQYELLKALLYPITLVAMFFNLVQEDDHRPRRMHDYYEKIYLDSDVHKRGHISAIKSAIYTAIWAIGMMTLIP